MEPVKFASFVPFLYSKSGGHFYTYTRAVEEAVKKMGYDFQAFVSKRHIIQDLPDHWQPLLDDVVQILPVESRKRLSKSQKVINLFRLFRSFCKALRQCENSIIFIEEFRIRQLRMLYWALRWTKTPIKKLILLHRYSPDWYPKGYQNYIRKFPELLLITDSELLARAQTAFFERPVHVVPIPHTEYQERQQTAHLRAWWPGGIVREQKGLSTIAKLAKEPHEEIELFISINAKPLIGDQLGLTYLPDLSSDAYIKEMAKTDLCLLPYDPKTYTEATSGIFVEAIVAGALPFVPDHTWMAFELRRFGLDGLIIPWQHDNLWALLKKRYEDNKDALKPMQEFYRSYHSTDGFSRACLQLIK